MDSPEKNATTNLIDITEDITSPITYDYLVSFKGSIVELSEQRGNAVVKQNFNLQSLREFKDKTLPIRIALSKDMPFFNWGF